MRLLASGAEGANGVGLLSFEISTTDICCTTSLGKSLGGAAFRPEPSLDELDSTSAMRRIADGDRVEHADGSFLHW